MLPNLPSKLASREGRDQTDAAGEESRPVRDRGNIVNFADDVFARDLRVIECQKMCSQGSYSGLVVDAGAKGLRVLAGRDCREIEHGALFLYKPQFLLLDLKLL